MKEASVRDFEISPNQYEPFRFWVERPATLNILLFATAPVNLVLLNSEQKVEYEKGENKLICIRRHGLGKETWKRR